MNNDALREKFAAIYTNQLVTLRTTPVWEPLLSLLTPINILSLARATAFSLPPTRRQMCIYMPWWRQIFYNLKFIQKNVVYAFSKDIKLLKAATQRWDYIEADKVKLLVVVQETSIINERQVLRSALMESVSTSYMWHTNQHTLLSQEQLVQTCIIFF